jgi:hypothetical protein
MACACFDRVNKHLAERNTKLDALFNFSNGGAVTVALVTSLVEKKRGARPCIMAPTYCPFCGKKYEKSK